MNFKELDGIRELFKWRKGKMIHYNLKNKRNYRKE